MNTEDYIKSMTSSGSKHSKIMARISSKSSLISLVISILTAVGAVYGFTRSSFLREQDNKISRLHELELDMFGAEIENPKLICLYSDYKTYNVDCEASDAAVSSKNAGYVSLAVSFLESIEEYNQEWCSGWSPYFFVRECKIYEEYKIEVCENKGGAIYSIWKERKRVSEQEKCSS